MAFSSKTRIALNALLDLAEVAQDVPLSLPQLAQRHNISASYLEQIFSALRQTGILHVVRGQSGGYQVGKPLNTITLADITRALEERFDPNDCNGEANCHDGTPCLAHNIWRILMDHMDAYLGTVTLADIVKLNTHLKQAPQARPQKEPVARVRVSKQAAEPSTLVRVREPKAPKKRTPKAKEAGRRR